MSFTERAGLFPVLLLTGCAQPAVITGPPSGSVVDSMLSRSAADISAMQYRVHQTGPSAQRPASILGAKTSATLLTHVPSSSPLTVKPAAISPFSVAPITGTKSGAPLLTQASSASALTTKSVTPVSAAGAGPVDGFVRQDGAEPTLRAALRKIIPPGQTVVFDKAVFADTPQLWRWKGNDRWKYVADKMLAMRGMKASVNEKAHTVTVEPAQHVQSSHAVTPAVSMPVPAATPVTSVPASAAKATLLPAHNPFSGGKVVTSSSSVKQTSIPGPAPHTSTVFAKVPVVVLRRHWHIETGYTVKDWLTSQAAAETCTVPGIKNWTIAWLTPTNYRIDAPLNFDGSFREMLDWLFTLYGAAKVPLYAGVHAAQCVVPVDDKEVH